MLQLAARLTRAPSRALVPRRTTTTRRGRVPQFHKQKPPKDRDEVETAVARMRARLGLDAAIAEFQKNYAAQLSGDVRQRTAVAGALLKSDVWRPADVLKVFAAVGVDPETAAELWQIATRNVFLWRAPVKSAEQVDEAFALINKAVDVSVPLIQSGDLNPFFLLERLVRHHFIPHRDEHIERVLNAYSTRSDTAATYLQPLQIPMFSSTSHANAVETLLKHPDIILERPYELFGLACKKTFADAPLMPFDVVSQYLDGLKRLCESRSPNAVNLRHTKVQDLPKGKLSCYLESLRSTLPLVYRSPLHIHVLKPAGMDDNTWRATGDKVILSHLREFEQRFGRQNNVGRDILAQMYTFAGAPEEQQRLRPKVKNQTKKVKNQTKDSKSLSNSGLL